jgi:pimeloyl-ACP methyl ester carboxylesterase
VFANWFVSKGIAALVYDRRGVGRSRGDTSTTGFPELAQDAANAATALKQIPNIDPNRIGVWGQSQGGWIAPLAAARSRDISWVIAQSGPAVTASEQDVFRTEHQAIAEGLTQQEVREATHYIRLVDRWRNEGVGREQVITAAKQAQGKRWASLVPLYDERIPDHIPEGRRDKFWLFDPLPDYSRVRVPILILYGDKDAYVPITKSVALWRRAISKSGNRSARIVVLHNATHSYWVGRHDGLADLAESPGFHPDYWPTLDRFLQQYVLHRKGGLPAQTSRNHSLTSASDASYWEEWAESCHWDRSSTEHLLQFVQKRLIYPSALACLS